MALKKTSITIDEHINHLWRECANNLRLSKVGLITVLINAEYNRQKNEQGGKS